MPATGPESLLKLGIKAMTSVAVEDKIEVINSLPVHLKDGLRSLLLKRGCVTERSLPCLLHGKVREIDLSEMDGEVTQGMINALIMCPNLQKLNLNNIKCTFPVSVLNGVLGQIGGNLSVLYLRRSIADSSTLETLAKTAPHITELDLGLCAEVGDPGLTALVAGCPRLTSLNLSRTAVSDSGLTALATSAAGRDHLVELRVDGCREVTDEGIEGLLLFSSKLTILMFHNCPKVTERSRSALEEYLLNNRIGMRQVAWTVY